MTTLLRIEGLGKQYELGASAGRGKERETLWALRDVTLDLPRGVTLGVIGSNGAGKTTLLRVLARITAPTEGRIVGQGRVFPLLELGAAFHEEFSVRENIFMSAAMFRVPRAEAVRKLESILAFAGAADSADRPLGEISRSAYVRLAFSVAVNMTPDLLLADEVLAVGDAEFKQQVAARLREEKKRGLTILFVSHDMRAIVDLCDEVVWLDHGRVRAHGAPDEIVAQYEHALLLGASQRIDGDTASAPIRLLNARLVGETGDEVGAITQSDPVVLELHFDVLERGLEICPGADLYCDGKLVMSCWADPSNGDAGGRRTARLAFPPAILSARPYQLKCGVSVRRGDGPAAQVYFENDVALTVYGAHQPDLDGALAKRQRTGLVAPSLNWKRTPPRVPAVRLEENRHE